MSNVLLLAILRELLNSPLGSLAGLQRGRGTIANKDGTENKLLTAWHRRNYNYKGLTETALVCQAQNCPPAEKNAGRNIAGWLFLGLHKTGVISRKYAFTTHSIPVTWKCLFSWSHVATSESNNCTSLIIELLFQSNLPLNFTREENKLPGFKLRA